VLVRRTLDRLPSRDPRNRNFLRAVTGQDLVRKTWRLDYRLDQGQQGACVGFGWTHRLDAAPRRRKFREPFAVDLYHRAQLLDEYQGEDYEGSSVLGGAKAAQRGGHISEYRWAYDLQNVLQALSHEGPVVMGTNWLADMFEPRADGYLQVAGSLAGGHCWLLRGIDPAKQRVTMSNSWGRSWGLKGDAYLTFDDLGILLSDGGEACVPTETPRNKVVIERLAQRSMRPDGFDRDALADARGSQPPRNGG
jgi:hypothetical protein